MSIDKYSELDLTEFRAELLAGAGKEASLFSIDLSSEFDRTAPCAGLSPHEQICFNKYIAQARMLALSAASGAARLIRLDGNQQGMLGPVQDAEATRQYHDRLRHISEEFSRKNASLMKEYVEKDREYLKHKNSAGGREAKTPSNLFIWGILFPMVMIPEALLNFETFRKVPQIKSDAVALGITILVALGIAWAAHQVGTFIRQYHYFSRANDPSRSSSGWPMLWIGLVTLLICLAAVAYGRYFYISPLIQQALVIGQTPPSLLTSLIGMLAGNLICFMLGLGFAFHQHDPNPEYEAAARRRLQLQKRLASLRVSTIDKPASDARRRLLSDLAENASLVRVMEGNPAYATLLSDYQRVVAKDFDVVSVLQLYRQALASQLESKGAGFCFQMSDLSGNPVRPVKNLSVSEYLNYPISLRAA